MGVVLLSLWFPRRLHVLAAGVACTLLTVAGFFLSPAGGILWMVLFNRALALFAVWVTAILGLRFRETKLLRESEARFRSFAEKTSVCVFVFEGTDVKYVNPAGQQLFGYTEEELLEMKFWDRVQEYHQDLVRQRGFARQYGEEVPSRYEVQMVTQAGETRWLDVTLSSFQYNEKPAVLGTALDITERREAREVLQKSEERYRDLFDNSWDLIHSLDAETRIQYANRRWLETLGYTLEEARQLKFENFVHPDYLDMCNQMCSEVKQGKSFPNFEPVFRAKDGRKIYLEGSCSPHIVNGRFEATRGFFRDVTERKKTEQALQKSEKQLLDAQHIAQLGNWEWEIATDRLDCSEEIFRLFGISRESFKGTYEEFRRSVYPEDREFVQNALDEALHTKAPYSTHFRVQLPDGAERVIHEQADVILNEESRPVRFVGIAHDITEYNHLEERLRQSEKLRAVGLLAGGVAHDFNNLLMVIGGYGEMLLGHFDENDPKRKEAEEIQRATRRATSLTQQLLAFSRKQVLQSKVLDLNSVVVETEKMLRRLIGEDIELVTALSPGLHHTKADPGQIDQVILNLAINARDAMPTGGKLILETANVELDEIYTERHAMMKPGSYVMLSVSDTGRGMDEETRSRIFEPFFTTKEKGRGTGLGLSTVYGIIKQSGGFIWVYSEPGQGTSFKIYLPQTREPLAGTDRAQPRPRPRVAATPRTVLLVEDEMGVRKLTGDFLISKGYTVLEAQDGDEAVEIFNQHLNEIDLLITDVVMPRMSGPELAKVLQSLRSSLKVLYMSGYTDNTVIHRGSLQPDTPFLQKPFSLDTLAGKVSEFLEEKSVRETAP